MKQLLTATKLPNIQKKILIGRGIAWRNIILSIFGRSCLNHSRYSFVSALLLLCLNWHVHAQIDFGVTMMTAGTAYAGKIEFGFQSPGDVACFKSGTGFYGLSYLKGTVSKVVDAGNNKVYALGSFNEYDGKACRELVRLNADGTLDNSFAYNHVELAPYGIGVLANGKIIAVGYFTVPNGKSYRALLRINTDGSIDPFFKIGSGINYGNNSFLTPLVTVVREQKDGKIIVAGQFTDVNGTRSQNIIRLLPDGTVDPGFSTGTGFNNFVNDVQILPNGKILVCGNFSTYNGVSRSLVAGLNSDGSLDSGFVVARGTIGNNARSITLLASGKILVSGDGNGFVAPVFRGLVRLFPDGKTDESFSVGQGTSNPGSMFIGGNRVFELTDSSIFVAGHIKFADTVAYNGIIKIDKTGKVQGVYEKSRGFDYGVADMTIRTDKLIIVAGPFTKYGNVFAGHIAGLTAEAVFNNCLNADDQCVLFQRSSDPLPDSLSNCGDSLVLNAWGSFRSYLWSNGATASSISAKTTGWYRVTVTGDQGCSARDSVFVNLVKAKVFGGGAYCASREVNTSFWIDSASLAGSGITRTVMWSTGERTFLINKKVEGKSLRIDATITQNGFVCVASGQASVVGGSYSADTLIVTSDSLKLKAPAKTLYGIIAWSGYGMTNKRNLDSVFVSRSGLYSYVWASSGPCPLNKDFYVEFVRVDLDSRDTSICAGASLSLTAKIDTAGSIFRSRRILWSTGDTIPSISVRPARTTKYYVTVSHGDVSARDSVTVTVTPAPAYNPFGDTTFSTAAPARLDAGVGYAKYNWNNGALTQAISVSLAGKYRVSVTSAQGCIMTDSTVVQFPDTLGMIIPTMQGLCGNTLDVPVKAYAFRNMLTLQGSVNWNPADLRFEAISAYGTAALGMSSANLGVSQTADGRLSFSWNDPSTTGLTISDTVTLFVMRFTPLGTGNRSVSITITGTPTVLESYDARFRRKILQIRNGSISLRCVTTVSGRVLTPLGDPVAGVTLTMTGTEQKAAVTGKDGYYALQVLPGNYTLTPDKNNEKTRSNGVSTLDLALIQTHVLNTMMLNSPYKVIAADADGSGAVTTVDIVHLRRLILGMDSSLPGNRTWTFVDSGQLFSNPLLPFPFVRNKTFANLLVNARQTFRAIKLGDVNWDRNPLVDQPLLKDSLQLYYEVKDEGNGVYVVEVRSRNAKRLMGIQYTLNWDPNVVEYTGPGQNPLGMHFGVSGLQEGALGMLWNDPNAKGRDLEPGALLFELRFRSAGSVVRPKVWLSSDKVLQEAFDDQYLTMGVTIAQGSATAGVEFSVYPNPASQWLHVRYESDRQGDGDIVLLDMQGRIVYRKVVRILPGSNTYRLSLAGRQPPRGIYTLRLTERDRQRVTRVMIGYE